MVGTPEDRPRILVVDDEKFMRDILADFLGLEGYIVRTAPDGKAALEALEHAYFHLVITDLKMPRLGGIELLETIRSVDSSILTIIMTGFGTVETAIDAMKRGAYDYVLKPFKMEEVIHIVQRGLEKQALQSESRNLQHEIAAVRVRAEMALEESSSVALESLVEATRSSLEMDEAIGWVRRRRAVGDHTSEIVEARSPREAALVHLDRRRIEKAVALGGSLQATGADVGRFFAQTVGPVPSRLLAVPLRPGKNFVGVLATCVHIGRWQQAIDHAPYLGLFAAEGARGLEPSLGLPRRKRSVALGSSVRRRADWLTSRHAKGEWKEAVERVQPPQEQQAPLDSLTLAQVFPHVVGGLIHNTNNNVMVSLRHWAEVISTMDWRRPDATDRAVGAADRILRDIHHISAFLRTLHAASREYYSTSTTAEVGFASRLEQLAEQYREAYPQLHYEVCFRVPTLDSILPVGLATMIVGELIENATRACTLDSTRDIAAASFTAHYHTTWASPHIHYATCGAWTDVPGEAMNTESDGWFVVRSSRWGGSVEFAFNDGAGTWDNNDKHNYVTDLREFWVKDGQAYANKPANGPGQDFCEEMDCGKGDCDESPGAKIVVTINADCGEICIQCEDTGRSFPQEVLANLNSGTLRAPNQPHSGGYGLFHIQEIAHRLEGTLEASNRTPDGSLVRVILPRRTPA